MIRNSGSKTKAMSLDVPLGQEMPPPGKVGQ
jgi:hypothetical protein